MNKNKHQFDPIWKSLIEDLFPDFLRFFFSDADMLFDMRRFEFLDKELEKLYPDKETDRNVRFVDKLVKVQWKSGGEQWILVHIEVQGYADKQFAHRMFQYFYRILDRYRRPVTAIVIFTGVQGFPPERYEIELLGTRLEYQYNTYRVIDQEDETLKSINNPFALVMLAAKTALLSGKATDEELMNRHEWIFRALAGKKLSQRKIIAIYAFLQNCIRFADSETYATFEKKIGQITDKRKIMGVKEYLIQQGREEGYEKGVEEGKELFVKNLLSNTDFTIAKIASLANVTQAFVKKVRTSLQKKK